MQPLLLLLVIYKVGDFLAKCPDCNKEISYSQLLRLTFSRKKECPFCSCVLYETAKSRNKTSMLTLFPVLSIGFIMGIFRVPIMLHLIAMVIVGVSTLFIVPFFQKYSKKEEPLF